MAKTKVVEKENVELCEGVMLAESFFDKKEKRIFTLMLKGLVVYLLSMGSIGFYLSAFNIRFNFLMVHGIVFAMAFVCAGLYYRLWTENLGYLMLLILFGLFVYRYRIIINSGFYAIVNITVDTSARYFDVDVQKLYTEQVENRYLTVTMVSIFIGIVLDIILNVYISRRMQYMTAIFITMFLNLIPLYLEQEPDTFYVLMLLTGIVISVFFKAGKHYSPQIAIRRNDNKFEQKRKKEIAYVYDAKIMLQTIIIVMTVLVCFITVFVRVKPKGTFNRGYTVNKYKEVTMAAFSTFLLDGWQGFFKFDNKIGGLESGKLGDTSSVKIDHMTDLVVMVAPYNYEPIYLKNFVGVNYNPYDNFWSAKEDNKTITPEANSLKQAYDNDETNTAQGTMYIKNVGGRPGADYVPYYTKEVNDGEQGYDEMIFYPRLEGNRTKVDWSLYGDNKPYGYEELYIHPDNREVIADFAEEIGATKDEKQLTATIKEYFQENIPYTIRPGKIPRRKDFINYFLTEGRKGYCSYFASAAVMIYRYEGIPARYVEGYCISYEQILSGELVENKKYSDVYDGYTELGETALVRVNVSDADAHAWVEIYNEDEGWHLVDVTPSSNEEEDDVEDFWSSFDRIMNGNDANMDEDDALAINVSDDVIDRTMMVFLLFVLGLIAIAIVAVSRKHFIFIYKYSRANLNDKLVMLYGVYWKKLAKKNSDIAENINYKEQVNCIFQKGIPSKEGVIFDKNRIINILEVAGFSNKAITDTDFNMVKEWMKQFKKLNSNLSRR